MYPILSWQQGFIRAGLWEKEQLRRRQWGQRGGWPWLKNNHHRPLPGPGAARGPVAVPQSPASKQLSSSCEERLLKTFKCSLNVFSFPPAYLYYFDIKYNVWVMHHCQSAVSISKINEKIYKCLHSKNHTFLRYSFIDISVDRFFVLFYKTECYIWWLLIGLERAKSFRKEVIERNLLDISS